MSPDVTVAENDPDAPFSTKPVKNPKYLTSRKPKLPKGERLLVQTAPPKTSGDLPAFLRCRLHISFDTQRYELRQAAWQLLAQHPDIGSFENQDSPLECLRAEDEIFRSFDARQRLREYVATDEQFLSHYEHLVTEVLCPLLKRRLEEGMSSAEIGRVRFVYQYPPTLRVQPGRSQQFKRPHRDAEYGHQVGEVNFWMPLTNYHGCTETALWVESFPDVGDYSPLDIDYGTIAMFHGTLCRHHVPLNSSEFTRISMDFRIGVGDFYDPDWSLEGVKLVHDHRIMYL